MKCNEISRSLPRFVCCSGDHLRQLYKPELCKDGTIRLHDAGQQDTDEFIESFRQSTELRTLIARFNAGDTGVFNAVPTFDGDFAEFPADLQQAYNILKVAESAFTQVPADQRGQYDNDFVKWISDYGSEKFLKTLGMQQSAGAAPSPSSDEKNAGENE